jgi:hypothetical protein
MKMYTKTLSSLCIAALCCGLLGSYAQAQSNFGSAALRRNTNRNSAKQFSSKSIRGQVNARSVARPGVLGVNRRTYSSVQQRAKPFKGLNRGPTVSPYLSLSGSLNGVSDYYNVVRPQQRQAQANAQMQRQNMANNRRLNQFSAASPYDLHGDPDLAPTGHSATYMQFGSFQSMGNYFPPPQGLEKQR